MKPEIFGETDSTQISNQIPTLPPMINVNNVPNPEDLGGNLSHSNLRASL